MMPISVFVERRFRRFTYAFGALAERTVSIELKPDGRPSVSRWINVDGDGVAFTLSYLND